MTDKPDLLALAAHVEMLDGPCRETDARITEAVALVPARFINYDGNGYFSDTGFGCRKRQWIAPRFTGSLDAATGLMPEGWIIAALAQSENGRACSIVIRDMADRKLKCGDANIEVNARTAAALRAIHEERG